MSRSSWISTRASRGALTLGGFGLAVGLARILSARDTRRAKRRIRGIAVLTVNRPVHEVYAFWHDLENLPRFMAHLESVRVLDGRSHWRAKAPLGLTVEWDARIVDDRPNERLAWRAPEGADVPNAGAVRFVPAPGGRGTEVHVEVSYDLAAGRLGAAVAKLFGEEPSEQIKGDLRRFKQVIETGEVLHSDASIHRGPHPARPPEEVRPEWRAAHATEALR